MAVLVLTTTMQFQTKGKLNTFIKKSLPLPTKDIDDLVKGKEVVDDQDVSEIPGVIRVLHKFKVEGTE